MNTSGDEAGVSTSRRNWSFVVAACWCLLGVWTLSAGETWLGLAQLALATSFLAAAVSTRVDAWDQAPLFRRKRTPDAG